MNGMEFMLNGHSILLALLMLVSAVVLLAVCRYFFAGAVRALRRRWDDVRSPQKAVSACVKEKRAVAFTRYHTFSHGIRSTGKRYFADFALDDGGQTELEVSAADYEKLKEGDRGTLRFKGSRFLEFEQA